MINLITAIVAAVYVALMVVNLVRMKRRNTLPSMRLYAVDLALSALLVVLNLVDEDWFMVALWTLVGGFTIGSMYFAARSAELRRRLTDG